MSRIYNDVNDLTYRDHSTYLIKCASIAKLSTCCRSRCGSVIVDNNDSDRSIIGLGYNSKPCNEGGSCFKDDLTPGFKSDKTCCVHAEQHAIIDALRLYPDEVYGSTLYFIRIDADDNMLRAGKPYCTI